MNIEPSYPDRGEDTPVSRQALNKALAEEYGNFVSVPVDLTEEIGVENAINLSLLASNDNFAYRSAAIALGLSKRGGSPGFVYMVKAGDTDLHKIGITRNIESRIRTLQTGCPHKLTLVCYFFSENTKESEASLHLKLSDERERGEWFRLESFSDCFIENIADTVKDCRKALDAYREMLSSEGEAIA